MFISLGGSRKQDSTVVALEQNLSALDVVEARCEEMWPKSETLKASLGHKKYLFLDD